MQYRKSVKSEVETRRLIVEVINLCDIHLTYRFSNSDVDSQLKTNTRIIQQEIREVGKKR